VIRRLRRFVHDQRQPHEITLNYRVAVPRAGAGAGAAARGRAILVTVVRVVGWTLVGIAGAAYYAVGIATFLFVVFAPVKFVIIPLF
jgi:hypothetical protein